MLPSCNVDGCGHLTVCSKNAVMFAVSRLLLSLLNKVVFENKIIRLKAMSG